MAKLRPLKNPPIVEAIVDLRVPRNASLSHHSFLEIREALRSDLPGEEAKNQREALVTLTTAGKLETNVKDLGFHGLFLKSEDGKTIVQFRPDGFTFSRLRPYTSWVEIREKAFAYWNMYVQAAGPSTVVRVALRYINRMRIPLKYGGDFSAYLLAAPIVPDPLPQLLSHFMTRIVLHEPKNELQANVAQTLERSDGEIMQVLFDIDAYRQHDFTTAGNELKPVFEQLHDFKNAIFFESLTEQALEAFD